MTNAAGRGVYAGCVIWPVRVTETGKVGEKNSFTGWEKYKNNSSVFSSSGHIGSDIETHKWYQCCQQLRQNVMFNKQPPHPTHPRRSWPCRSHRLTDKGCADLPDAAASHSNFQALSNLNSKCVLPLTPDPHPIPLGFSRFLTTAETYYWLLTDFSPRFISFSFPG